MKKNTPIIPISSTFYNVKTDELIKWNEIAGNSLDFKAISTFLALGFMLDDDTYYKNIKAINPATKYEVKNNIILNKNKYWDWHYTPNGDSFSYILEEFSTLFEKLVKKQIKNHKILLPISGGIDSRSLFIPLRNSKNLTLASYEFENGFPESEIGLELSQRFNIPFYSQKIQRGYLWNKLEDFHDLNNCFTDFTHSRQVDVIHQWKGLGEMVVLGHWGDVLFDKQADSTNISYDEQIIQLKKKIIKPGSMELSSDLWKFWGLEGSFESYLVNRLDKLYSNINIDHPSARMRAFKSLYWAPRWTSVNLSIFKEIGEIIIPYCNDEMCKFICNVPEKYLAHRKIQIEYIKKYCPEAAQMPWQKYYPLNLYNYNRFNHPYYNFLRVVRKIKRVAQRYLSKSPKLIERNWELQFLGDHNSLQLEKNLLKGSKFSQLIPHSIIRKYLYNFQVNPVKYADPLSMLLTLSVFSDKHYVE